MGGRTGYNRLVHILVIGGTRFVGKAIVQRLLADGHGVTLLNRGRTPDPFGTRVRRVVGDRSDPEAWRQALGRRHYDAVVDVIATREEHTRQATAALAGRTDHFVHISTASVYLIRHGAYCPYREQDFAGRLLARTAASKASWLYADHKRRAEVALQEAWEADRFPGTALRLPVVVGPGDHTERASTYLERLADGGPVLLPDGGLNSWGFLWVSDVADAVAAVLANPATRGAAYNLAQREVVTLRQLVQALATELGVPLQAVSVPAELLARLGLGTSFSPYTHDADIVLDTSAARRDLLFEPTPFPAWCASLVSEWRAAPRHRPTTFYASRPRELQLVDELRRLRLLEPAAGDAGSLPRRRLRPRSLR